PLLAADRGCSDRSAGPDVPRVDERGPRAGDERELPGLPAPVAERSAARAGAAERGGAASRRAVRGQGRGGVGGAIGARGDRECDLRRRERANHGATDHAGEGAAGAEGRAGAGRGAARRSTAAGHAERRCDRRAVARATQPPETAATRWARTQAERRE